MKWFHILIFFPFILKVSPIMAMDLEAFEEKLKIYKKTLSKPYSKEVPNARKELLTELLAKRTFEELRTFYQKVVDLDESQMLPRKLIQIAAISDNEKEFEQRMNSYKEWKTFIEQSRIVREMSMKNNVKDMTGVKKEESLPFEVSAVSYTKPSIETSQEKYLAEVTAANAIAVQFGKEVKANNSTGFLKLWAGDVDEGKNAFSKIMRDLKNNNSTIEMAKSFAHYDIEYEANRFKENREVTIPFIWLDSDHWPMSEGKIKVIKINGQYKITSLD